MCLHCISNHEIATNYICLAKGLIAIIQIIFDLLLVTLSYTVSFKLTVLLAVLFCLFLAILPIDIAVCKERLKKLTVGGRQMLVVSIFSQLYFCFSAF